MVSIGTTHPLNVAGTGLDARVCAEYGVRNATVVAAVSAQGPSVPFSLAPLSPAALRAQLAAVKNLNAAYRIGALPTAQSVEIVAAFLREVEPAFAVVDPVFNTTAGEALADAGAVEATRRHLATAPVILTPNLEEAAILLSAPVGRASMAEAAVALQRRGPVAVLLKGGHLDGAPVDVLATAGGVEEFHGERLPGSMRGTGCVLAAALACELARGAPLREAAIRARAYVAAKIGAGRRMGAMQVAF